MNTLILGCGGFIGCHLIEALLKEGHTVTGVDFSSYKIERHLSHDNFIFIKSDIYDLDAESLVAESDVVIFLATICNPYSYVNSPVQTILSNFSGPSKIVDMCVKHNVWYINFSSCEIYGRTISSYADKHYMIKKLYEQKEETTPLVMGPIHNQRWCYASAKQLLDRYIYANHTEKGLEFTSIRPYNFVGTKLDYISNIDGNGVPRVVACFVEALLKRTPMKLVNGGSAMRTFTYIDDAIDALMIILNNKEQSKNRFFNIANPANEVSVAGLADLMRGIFAQLKDDPTYLYHPIITVDGKDFYGNGYEDCDRRVPNIENITSLGWKPVYNLHSTFYNVVKGFLEYYDPVKQSVDMICA